MRRRCQPFHGDCIDSIMLKMRIFEVVFVSEEVAAIVLGNAKQPVKYSSQNE